MVFALIENVEICLSEVARVLKLEDLLHTCLLNALGQKALITFESHDFVLEKSPLECLTLFSEGMYQFSMIQDEKKSQALRTCLIKSCHWQIKMARFA